MIALYMYCVYTTISLVSSACSLSGSPATTRWYFGVQVCRGATQVRKSEQSKQFWRYFSKFQITIPLPSAKDLLPLLGALKHMACWQAAKINIVTQNISGWEKVATSLSARLLEPAELFNCINYRELWRGGLVIREKKVSTGIFLSSLCVYFIFKKTFLYVDFVCVFFFFFLHILLSLCSVLQVFHYYAPVLDLVQVVDLSELPTFLMSNTHFELVLSGKSVKAKLLLDQLSALRGKVGALFSLSCTITPITQPPASQLSSQRWKECLSRTPKAFLVPDVEVKGESAVYFLLVQGADDVGSGTCRVRLMHSHSQLNGAAAMATLSSLLREKPFSSGILYDKTAVFLCQEILTFVFIFISCTEPLCPGNKLCPALNCILFIPELQTVSQQPSDWPERTVLHNIENLQRKRQRKRLGLLGPGSTESLLGPKDSQRGSSALLDAKELLKHFTSDGLPTGELQPLAISRGNNMFQLSPDLSPRTISRMPFSVASSAHYHGIEFCLDKQRSLDRDQAFVRLQSRLIRYETQTTCSKEPCALPFALSPAPSPAVMSEPGSVPDGETLQNNEVAQLKRRSWDTDVAGGYPRKRLVKSESSDSLCSQSSGSSGTHPSIRSLRQQANRSQSASSCTSLSSNYFLCSHRCTNTKLCVPPQMLQEIVAKTLKHHGIAVEHECFEACSKRLFDISKFYLKDLKTSRGLHEEMKKAASSNVKQVVDWVLEKSSKKGR
uniref:MDM2 binding protein n=1 Tax=Poecilia reticulata TaxID=8081 RepID=A0A3P9NYT5_POERE